MYRNNIINCNYQAIITISVKITYFSTVVFQTNNICVVSCVLNIYVLVLLWLFKKILLSTYTYYLILMLTLI